MELELIRQADPEVADAIGLELNRQRTHVELIASENFVSPAVMAALAAFLASSRSFFFAFRLCSHFILFSILLFIVPSEYASPSLYPLFQ